MLRHVHAIVLVMALSVSTKSINVLSRPSSGR